MHPKSLDGLAVDRTILACFNTFCQCESAIVANQLVLWDVLLWYHHRSSSTDCLLFPEFWLLVQERIPVEHFLRTSFWSILPCTLAWKSFRRNTNNQPFFGRASKWTFPPNTPTPSYSVLWIPKPRAKGSLQLITSRYKYSADSLLKQLPVCMGGAFLSWPLSSS